MRDGTEQQRKSCYAGFDVWGRLVCNIRFFLDWFWPLKLKAQYERLSLLISLGRPTSCGTVPSASPGTPRFLCSFCQTRQDRSHSLFVLGRCHLCIFFFPPPHSMSEGNNWGPTNTHPPAVCFSLFSWLSAPLSNNNPNFTSDTRRLFLPEAPLLGAGERIVFKLSLGR